MREKITAELSFLAIFDQNIHKISKICILFVVWVLTVLVLILYGSLKSSDLFRNNKTIPSHLKIYNILFR